LKVHYENWRECPADKKDYIIEKYVLPPQLPIREYLLSFFEELTSLLQSKDPFVIKNDILLPCSKETLERAMDRQVTPVHGYTSSITWDENHLPIREVWEHFHNGTLKFNVVDAPMDDKSMLSETWDSYAKKTLGEQYKYALTWVFTKTPTITHFHIDPEYAGGYMKLISGKKIWWFVLPTDMEYLKSKGHTVETMATLSYVDLMQLEEHYLFGKIRIHILEPGDLLWFPIGTLHKVITLESSHGVGGYM
jgi:hypothetical protein